MSFNPLPNLTKPSVQSWRLRQSIGRPGERTRRHLGAPFFFGPKIPWYPLAISHCYRKSQLLVGSLFYKQAIVHSYVKWAKAIRSFEFPSYKSACVFVPKKLSYHRRKSGWHPDWCANPRRRRTCRCPQQSQGSWRCHFHFFLHGK